MPRPRFAALAAVLSLLALPAWALDLAPLKGAAATLHWDGQQFIQADAHGDVFLLRSDPLQVYPVTRSHELGEPVRLEPTPRSGFPLDAAMSPDGSWAVNLGSRIHQFVADGREVPLPQLAPGLKPLFVGFLRGDLVATVVPVARGAAAGDHAVPLLVRAANDSWSTELGEPQHSPEDPGMERAYRAAMVFDAREGRYFLARQYSYRIELRRLGRNSALEELRLGDGPVLKKYTDAERARLLGGVKAATSSQPSGGTIHLAPGRPALVALTRRGAAGPLYALLAAGIAGEGCALDRIAWDERRVERIPLSFPCKGRVSIAAGRDGLYFAEWNGQEGRFFVSWTALDEAKWTAVKEAVFAP
jgi:hypothetical protein